MSSQARNDLGGQPHPVGPGIQPGAEQDDLTASGGVRLGHPVVGQPNADGSAREELFGRRLDSLPPELFSERGYEKTSFRELAERLGVTKAALYYHFRTKEDIVVSLSDDLRGGIDDIVTWAEQTRPRHERAEQILRRYSALPHNLGRDMVRFWHARITWPSAGNALPRSREVRHHRS
ncbi:helix-turn-helix domain-containing protein [Nocardia fluminea]|uniref:helix-turn-helix domain-containing protein n=1 Tax=Nocardia fluminea TaxID=134984 RepID=UPI00380D354B